MADTIMGQKCFTLIIFLISCCSSTLFLQQSLAHDYAQALDLSFQYFEAQRSGALPSNQRATWRSDSGLEDGKDQGIDLVGGYYDAGDNVKFQFPMAYTITTLAWGVIEYRSQLDQLGQLQYALDAVKWGTDYFIKAHPEPNAYGQSTQQSQVEGRSSGLRTGQLLQWVPEGNPERFPGTILPNLPNEIFTAEVWPRVMEIPHLSWLRSSRRVNHAWRDFIARTEEWNRLLIVKANGQKYRAYLAETGEERVGLTELVRRETEALRRLLELDHDERVAGRILARTYV
ncbi:hypothetical protein R1sor_017414 [Riccia sorocarpa]|uniref:cellulase n=1 Tax=Riccia sorocarpa TaxID=122646 RepID=A0ABD3I6T6_9MARC